MPDSVTLMGLDFGTTTSSAVVATASLTRSAATGRMELSQFCERYRSEMIFTPLDEEDRLDLPRLEACLDGWMAAGQVRAEDIFGGGALLTGLTAQKQNAAALVRLIRRRLGEALIATADDPCLESWLAFMGSCAGLSRARPRQPILNLDIGGGTTNLAFGVNGEVLRTGCLFVGARHVQLVPGSYRIVSLSRYARAVLEHLRIPKGPGDDLRDDEVEAILDFYLAVLKAAAAGEPEALREPIVQLHVQAPLRRPPTWSDAAVTFSGGVGELIYKHLRDGVWPPTTYFGDLGIDLAQRIVSSSVWSRHLQTIRPASAGRATVYGLLRHGTEVSGSTLYLPSPEVLPWANVPILGALSADSDDGDVECLLELARRSSGGGCLHIKIGGQDAPAVSAMGQKLARALRAQAFPPAHPLLLLVGENVGKVLGHFVTEWGSLPLNLVVIDEISPRDAQYVQIGSRRGQVVPVSFYGLNEPVDA